MRRRLVRDSAFPATQSDKISPIALLAKEGVYVHPGISNDFARVGHAVVSLIVPEDNSRKASSARYRNLNNPFPRYLFMVPRGSVALAERNSHG